MTLSLYVPGSTPMHRLPAGLKLGFLLVAGIVIALAEAPMLLALLAIAGLVLLSTTRAPFPVIRGQLAGLAVIVVIVLAANWLVTNLAAGVAFALRVVALVSLASAVTFTTRTDAILEFIERGLSRFGRPGRIAGERLGLAVALVVRFVPELFATAGSIREACAARGLRPSAARLLLPLLVRSIATADHVADALEARGYPREG